MTELVDYSGQFDPQFTHYNFTKETLLNLLESYSGYIHKLDGLWLYKVTDECGEDVAHACDGSIAEESLLYELRVMTSLLNIHGDDVATVMKYLQVSPWSWGAGYEIDLKNNDYAIITYYSCPILFAIEKEGTGREKTVCGELEPKVKADLAHYFNPNIKVTGLKVPPRTDYNDFCCQWEYRLDR